MNATKRHASIFDYAEAQRRKEVGMHLAANARPTLLGDAQTIAKRIALRWEVVTSDDVAAVMMAEGMRYEDLGNAAGSVFRSDFAWTGKVTSSIRPSTHKRMIKVWRLK
jgi:hypothetical protein